LSGKYGNGKLSSEDLVKIGFLRKPHGLDGFLKMTCLTDFASERFQPGTSCMVLKEEQPLLSVEIAECKSRGSDILIRFEGRESIEDAEELRNSYLCVEYSDRISLQEDDFYVDQLVGLDVFTDSGLHIGSVIRVEEVPANPILEILGTEEGRGKPILVPFVKALIESVDMDGRRIELSSNFSIRIIE